MLTERRISSENTLVRFLELISVVKFWSLIQKWFASEIIFVPVRLSICSSHISVDFLTGRRLITRACMDDTNSFKRSNLSDFSGNSSASTTSELLPKYKLKSSHCIPMKGEWASNRLSLIFAIPYFRLANFVYLIFYFKI